MASTDKETTLTLNELIAEHYQQRMTSLKPEAVVERFLAKVEAQREAVFLRMMGLDKDMFGGEWRIDHCNGRSGNSPIGEAIHHIFLKQLLPLTTKVANELTEDSSINKKVSALIKKMLEDKMVGYAVREQVTKQLDALVAKTIEEIVVQYEEQIKSEVEKTFKEKMTKEIKSRKRSTHTRNKTTQ